MEVDTSPREAYKPEEMYALRSEGWGARTVKAGVNPSGSVSNFLLAFE